MKGFDVMPLTEGVDLLMPVVKPRKPKLCGICQRDVPKRVRRIVQVEIPGGGTTPCSALLCPTCEPATYVRHIQDEDGRFYSVPVIEVAGV